MRGNRSRWLAVSTVVVGLALGAGVARGQSSESAPLAVELAQLMAEADLGAIAAKDPSGEERFVAALYFGGRQLLAVAADYSAPDLLQNRIIAGDYRDVYVDLNSASSPETKFFVGDFGANGLRRSPDSGAAADRYNRAGRAVSFDGDWSRQQMSEAEYGEVFADADRDFASLLSLLIAQIRES